MTVIVALIVAVTNLLYVVFKDKKAMIDTDKKECIEVLKSVFEQSVKNRQSEQDGKFNMIILDAYVNALKHLKLVKINKKEKILSKFALKVNRYNEGSVSVKGSISDEELIGCFTDTIESVYNLELNLKEYLFDSVRLFKIWK
ncbi:MAG: hypothetical protein ACTTIC_06025 [Helicobacteraceae bacterium]